jgi:RNA polymerase sigma-70 factor (ECF subfamily)
MQIQHLIDRSKNGDMQAFGLLVAEYQSLVFRLAFRLLGDENEAEDLTQEVFIKIWLRIKRYKPEYQFSTWVYKITVNLCYDCLRAAERNRQKKIRLSECPNVDWISSENIEKMLVNKELSELILRYTDSLSPKQKLLFTLCDIEGLENDEIQNITGLSAGKIKSNLYLARKSIKEKLNAITSYVYGG